jgi:hypothetical protein
MATELPEPLSLAWELNPVSSATAEPATTRRRNRTYQPWGYHGLPVLKTGWATRPVPRRR